MIDAKKLVKGQELLIILEKVKDRLPIDLLKILKKAPKGIWYGGYKMVDGNSFALILELLDGKTYWFFEEELSTNE